MRHYIFFISFFYLVCQTNGFAQGPLSNTPLFKKEVMLMHVKTLSSDTFEGRRTGTKGGVKAGRYIVNEFHKLDIQPFGKTYEQPFMFYNNGNTYKGVNVLGLIKGTSKPDKYIVISAHYDHEGIRQGKIYNGADDNASGVAALFSFVEFFKSNPPKYSVIVAAFDGEELGLQGSKYFVNNAGIPLRKIILNINLDMIGRSDKNELYVVGSHTHVNFKSLFSNYKPYSAKLTLLTGHDGYDGKDNWIYSSDHGSFHKKGIPFLYFGVEDHEDYHEPTDDFERLHPEFYTHAVEQIISIFRKIDIMSF
ncbi:M28 family peptidase [Aestuariivivens sediminicola]|uniref:M28 family peptidase n=1 Tax=Aestuariivivens sediminicola TaxID=2913560 RepID=UPI001F57FC79|nr:M28 family peptidase [Aestuariivivens sediminicola]